MNDPMSQIHPLQAMVDAWGAAAQKARSGTQMTLGRLIGELEALPPDRLIVGLGKPMSYRGYYCDLAFDPTDAPEPVSALLARCRNAMGKVFEGYKGGDYMMGATTPVWVARYGDCGDRLMSLDTSGDVVSRVVSPDED